MKSNVLSSWLNQWLQNDVRSAARCRLVNRWPRKPRDEVVLFNKERNGEAPLRTEKYFEWITKQLLNSAFVGYEESCRILHPTISAEFFTILPNLIQWLQIIPYHITFASVFILQFSCFKIIFNTQEVFLGIIPDMLPNKIYINLKSEHWKTNSCLFISICSLGWHPRGLKKPKCLQIRKKIKTLSTVRATFWNFVLKSSTFLFIYLFIYSVLHLLL